MKKQLFALCAIALTLFAACNKEKDEPAVKGTFTLSSPAEVTVPTDGDIVTVSFTSTVDWTAALDVTDDVATLSAKSGTADATSVKVTVMKFDTENTTRTINLTFTPEGLDPVKVVLTQAGPMVPFFTVSETSLSVGADGGEVSFTISTNVEYETTTYESFEPWAPFAVNGTTGTFTVAANNAYGSRQAYVKFTVPSVQVTNEETGESSDLVVRVYVNQEGLSYKDYSLSMYDMSFNTWGTTVLSEAVYGDYHLVCDGKNVWMINSTSGEYSYVTPTLPDGWQLSITNDDAGHVIAFSRTVYDKTTEAYNSEFTVNVVTNPQTMAFSTIFTAYSWQLGGPVGSRVSVRGDITGEALICIVAEGIADVGMSGTFDYLQVSGGKVGDIQQVVNPAGLTATWGTSYWSAYPNNCPSVVAVSTNPADGFILSGAYEGNTFYKITTDGTATEILKQDPVQGSNYAYQTIDVRTIGGKTYLASLASTFFPSYGLTPRLDIIALDHLPAESAVIHEVADFDLNTTTYFPYANDPATDWAISPASDLKIYDKGGKIGVALCDLNGRSIEGFTFDPANF